MKNCSKWICVWRWFKGNSYLFSHKLVTVTVEEEGVEAGNKPGSLTRSLPWCTGASCLWQGEEQSEFRPCTVNMSVSRWTGLEEERLGSLWVLPVSVYIFMKNIRCSKNRCSVFENGVCVCVCVTEKETEKDRERAADREKETEKDLYIYIERERERGRERIQ